MHKSQLQGKRKEEAFFGRKLFELVGSWQRLEKRKMQQIIFLVRRMPPPKAAHPIIPETGSSPHTTTHTPTHKTQGFP
jgi:hypothetical protein